MTVTSAYIGLFFGGMSRGISSRMSRYHPWISFIFQNILKFTRLLRCLCHWWILQKGATLSLTPQHPQTSRSVISQLTSISLLVDWDNVSISFSPAVFPQLASISP